MNERETWLRSLPERVRQWLKARRVREAEREALMKQFRKDHDELHKRIREYHLKSNELGRYQRQIRMAPFIFIIVNILIWGLVFRFAGMKTFAVVLASIYTVGFAMQFVFLARIEKRILRPLDQLRVAVDEITHGNWGVRVSVDVIHEVSTLFDAFNQMAHRLEEGERVQAEYEENRKALIANISHDLKTPITSVQGYIEMLTDPSAVLPPEQQERYLTIIHRNAVYMNRLIDDLVLFSQLDMQKLQTDFVEVPAGAFLTDLMEEFQLELEEGPVTFSCRGQVPGDCRIKVDRKRMHQVFRNIIWNAVKYGPDKDLRITVDITSDGSRIAVRIGDNGPGIPAAQLPHIFRRFYRTDNERTKDLSSTGLGLAIARELAEAHGGSISAENIPGGGTAMTVILPLAQEERNGKQT